eukprot:5639917-Alexandrium_andersonii.AAC.2
MRRVVQSAAPRAVEDACPAGVNKWGVGGKPPLGACGLLLLLLTSSRAALCSVVCRRRPNKRAATAAQHHVEL